MSIEAMKLAREVIRMMGAPSPLHFSKDEIIKWQEGNAKLDQAIEQAQKQEPVATMPSNTRYTVEVEGHGRTYWDNIHDAITNAQRAVYSGPENTTRALDDLKAGRFAEWSYGFSAVRIYPPQRTTPPQRQPQFREFIKWAGAQGYDCAQTCNSDTGEWICLHPMTADLWKCWQAAHGIKGEA